jgi:hypothetical protein
MDLTKLKGECDEKNSFVFVGTIFVGQSGDGCATNPGG